MCGSAFAVGAANQNLNVFTFTTSQVLTGLGPLGFPDGDAIGEGSFAVLFDFDQSEDPSFVAGFNTPKHRIKGSFGNAKVTKNLGFNLNVRWNTEYLWESTMVDGMISEATVIDAQINYGIPKLKSVLKVGATNIGGKEYYSAPGVGKIGSQYFVSWTINP